MKKLPSNMRGENSVITENTKSTKTMSSKYGEKVCDKQENIAKRMMNSGEAPK